MTSQNPELEIDNILKEVQQAGLDNVQEIITDIEDLIAKRNDLSQEVFSDLENVKIKLNSFLSAKQNDMSVTEMIELKKKEIELEEEKTKEKINCWKDVANLKRELRIHVFELHDKVSGQSFLNNLTDF